MGSFLLSCNVTNQSIPEDAKVMIIPIVQAKGYYNVEFENNPLSSYTATKNQCYTNSLWEPIGIVFEGIAKDYGEQCLVDNLFNRRSLIVFFKHIFRRSLHTKKGDKNEVHENEYNSSFVFNQKQSNLYPIITNKGYIEISNEELQKIPFKEFEKTMKSLLEFVVHQRVFLSDYRGVPTQLGFSVSLSSSYQSVLKHTPQAAALEILFDKAKRFDEELSDYKKYFTKSDPSSKLFLYEMAKIDGGSEIKTEYHGLLGLTCNNKEPTLDNFNIVLKEMKEVLDFVQFQDGMNTLNLRLLPSFSGGQDYHNEIGIMYEKIMKEVNKETKAFLKKKYEE